MSSVNVVFAMNPLAIVAAKTILSIAVLNCKVSLEMAAMAASLAK